MTDLTYDEALAHVVLAETLTWLQQVKATIRFYDDDDGPRVRVAVRQSREPDDYTFALIPIADSAPESLAVSLAAAREEIEPLMRRGRLALVPHSSMAP